MVSWLDWHGHDARASRGELSRLDAVVFETRECAFDVAEQLQQVCSNLDLIARRKGISTSVFPRNEVILPPDGKHESKLRIHNHRRFMLCRTCFLH